LGSAEVGLGDLGPGEIRKREISAREVSALEMRVGESRSWSDRAEKRSISEVRTGKARACPLQLVERRSRENGPGEIHVGDVGRAENGARQICACEMSARKLGPSQFRALQRRPDKARRREQ